MVGEMQSFKNIPPDFQSELYESIAKRVKRGDSVYINGVNGSGNSLAVKALVQSEKIQKKYFGEDYKFLLFDANNLLERSSQQAILYLLRLLKGNIDETISEDLDLDSKYNFVMKTICRNFMLVIIFDHIAQLATNELKPFFNYVYTVCREYEPHVKFIFVSNKQNVDYEELSYFGSIARLISHNSIRIPVYNRKDSLWFIDEKSIQTGLKLNQKEKEKIFELAGGFPRTMKRIVESINRGNKLQELERDPSIDPAIILHFNELQNYKGELPEIPLFQTYINNLSMTVKNGGEEMGGLVFQSRLTKNEGKLLKQFLADKDRIVDRESAIENLWGENAVRISDHAYDQLILRLRGKLNNAVPEADIETVRGRGHILRISK